METIRPRIKIEDILVAHPKKRLPWYGKHPSIEDTGRGNTLCYEAWGGRLFFSDEGAVREAVDKFIENYDEIISSGEYYTETKIEINGVEYGEDILVSVSSNGTLFGDQNPTFGTAIAREIDFEMRYPDEAIPKTAEIRAYVRIYNDELVSGWIPKGVFRIDTRGKVEGDDSEHLPIHGYDDMLKAERDYPSSQHEWSETSPRARAVLDEIASAIVVELDDRTKVVFPAGSGYIVSFPAGYTMREVLCSIGAMYGGSFCISDEGKLLFIGLTELPTETNYLITQTGNFITFGGTRILLR